MCVCVCVYIIQGSVEQSNRNRSLTSVSIIWNGDFSSFSVFKDFWDPESFHWNGDWSHWEWILQKYLKEYMRYAPIYFNILFIFLK